VTPKKKETYSAKSTTFDRNGVRQLTRSIGPFCQIGSSLVNRHRKCSGGCWRYRRVAGSRDGKGVKAGSRTGIGTASTSAASTASSTAAAGREAFKRKK
jgi:hypothetical protein